MFYRSKRCIKFSFAILCPSSTSPPVTLTDSHPPDNQPCLHRTHPAALKWRGVFMRLCQSSKEQISDTWQMRSMRDINVVR